MIVESYRLYLRNNNKICVRIFFALIFLQAILEVIIFTVDRNFLGVSDTSFYVCYFFIIDYAGFTLFQCINRGSSIFLSFSFFLKKYKICLYDYDNCSSFFHVCTTFSPRRLRFTLLNTYAII